ncbi:pyridoxal-phosphate dependent enzyme [Bradyrhizobium sp. AUGA SZCCT0222]|uniref:threonine ammonia-lyase n=1 Tax=Bradyrhizobium sp. AUGA SZCCT0222 TaxID=2807668 RepID=UPI001BA5F455|nr:pyridoxal-phosphate dependent enzyme [Bradyrhizobium sp. AUGA SZCCT0222]MBR1272177.1 pyridoxal-phosphate dependent enzyme [Bradyrhizobium sp. AUGA SZCCT0222]
MGLRLPTFQDLEEAKTRISGHCFETPLVESPTLNASIGARLLLKAENLQITGSYKLRGAVNRLTALTEDERARGVVARSSGNHGLAVSYCASRTGTTATIVVPTSAPPMKVDRIRALGAKVIQVPMAATAAAAAECAERENRILVPTADDPWIVAGAGTVGLEIATKALMSDITIDTLLVCCSAGGLTAGCLLAFETLSPETAIYAVEPAGFQKMERSLAAGYCIDNAPCGHTICDSLSGPFMASVPFEIIKGRLAGTLAVTDEEAMAAMRVAFVEFGLAVEPGGAVALAAALSGRVPTRGQTIAVTISGRNVGLDMAGYVLGASGLSGAQS